MNIENKSSHGMVAVFLVLTSALLSACLDSGGDDNGDPGGSAALDTGFASNGTAVMNLGGDDFARAMVVDSADRIVIAGSRNLNSSGDFALVRFGADGTVDSSFGVGGQRVTDLGGDDRGRSVVIDAVGKIVVGGDSLVTASDFAIVRYNGDGTLDTTFGGDGIVITDFNGRGEPAMELAIDSNGSIVAAGFAHNGLNYDFAIARYNDDGSLDTTFSGDGMMIHDLGGDDRVSAVIIDAAGRIITAGRTGSASDYDVALARYNSDGSLDNTFGTNGVVVVDLGGNFDQAREVVVDASGRLVVAGRAGSSGQWNILLMRFNDDGSPDTGFGTNGVVTTDLGGNDRGRKLVLDASGRIVVVGTSDSQGDNDFTLLRYNDDGSLDTGFGSNGVATVDFGGDDRGTGIALDSGGRIVVAGRSDLGSGYDYAVARILP